MGCKCDSWVCDPLLPRHNHLLQPWLPIIAARPLIENGNPENNPPIAALAFQPELQIEDDCIRGHPMSTLEKARMEL
jgi:hypothetical protein